MKAALQISGQQRYGNFFPEFLKTLSAAFDEIDVFVHNWEGPNDAVTLGKKIAVQLPTNCALRKVQIDPQRMFVFLPHWKRHPGASNDGGPEQVMFRLISQLYGINNVNAIRQRWQKSTGVKYDRVIRARSDFKIEGDLKFDDPMTIYTGAPKIPLQNHMMQDQFAIGSPEDMDVYADMFLNLNEMHDTIGGFHPEMFFYWWTHVKNGIPVDQTGFIGVMENQHIVRESRDVK